MNRVIMMANSRQINAVYFTFYTRTAANKNVVCLFEGEDQKYYSVRINLMNRSLNWGGVNCGGKKNVLSLLRLVKRHGSYRNKKTYAFVDRDFDEALNEAEKGSVIYETPTYSIENFYCTDECLNSILDIEFKLNNNAQSPQLLSSTFAHYTHLKNEFHVVIQPLNHWIKAHRKKEADYPNISKLNLNNLRLNQYVDINFNQITCLINPAFIPNLFPDCQAISYHEIALEGSKFPLVNPEKFYRGKFEIEFVRMFLQLLKTETNNSASPFYNSGNNSGKLQLSKDNILSELSQYATTPNCLNEFIRRMAA